MVDTYACNWSFVLINCLPLLYCKQEKRWKKTSPRGTVPILSYPLWVNKVLGSSPNTSAVASVATDGKDAPSADGHVHQRGDGSHQTKQRICSTLRSLGSLCFIMVHCGWLARPNQQLDVLACSCRFHPMSSLLYKETMHRSTCGHCSLQVARCWVWRRWRANIPFLSLSCQLVDILERAARSAWRHAKKDRDRHAFDSMCFKDCGSSVHKRCLIINHYQ